MSETAKRYRAFVSYSQKDKAAATRLHKALEAYRLPPGVDAEGIDAKTRKLGRFFRDDEEMGAATDLGAALQGAIADAESLIVVCSPRAAQSRWVNEEIIHFKRTGRAEKIFAVIVSGEPNAAKPERECFPPALRFQLGADGALTDQPAEPLALDVRKEKFNRLVVRLAAGLANTPFDTLWKREQRWARSRLAAMSLAGTVALVILGVAATQFLWWPLVAQHQRYTQFVKSSASLAAAAAGATFQECEQGSSYCPLMVVIPEGRFLMGSLDADPESGETPQRELAVARFAVSQTEITFAQWNACFAAGACNDYRPDRAGWEGDDRPVINISWDDAKHYVEWLSQMTGQTYRLLSEAEWEYAARAQATTDAPHAEFSWGDDHPICDADAPNGAAFQDCELSSTWPVRSFAANAFGLHDMHGNALEWVEDCPGLYDPARRDGAPVVVVEGSPESCAYRVVRGGSWNDEPQLLRSAARKLAAVDYRDRSVGFRVARTI